MHEVRIAALAATNDPARARQTSTYKALIERVTGLPVKVYQSTDYNGVIQALASNQVEVATMGAGGYANVDAQVGPLVAPILTARDAEGSTGYYSVIMVKANSPYRTLKDLKGRSLGYVDFNSTSGYLFPRSQMRRQGIDPDTFFGKTGFAGGHIQAVMALENGQFDAAVVEMNGGAPETGFTAGPYFTLARSGLVNPKDFRTIWTAGPIPNAPMVVRTDRPQAFIDTLRGIAAALPYDDTDTWSDIGQVDGSTYAAVNRDNYTSIIKLRAEELAEHRQGRS